MHEKLYTRKTVLAAGAVGVIGASVGAKIIGVGPFAGAATVPYTWSRPVVNGGFCNVVAASPTPGEFFAGGDMYGEHRTEDSGATWLPTMWGASSIGNTYARAVAGSLLNPGTAYYGIATLKAGGGKFAVCTGYKIEYRASLSFGLPLGSGAGGTLPRPLGSLIDVTLAGGVETIWVAATTGLTRSTDQGHTWHPVAGTGGVQYRSIVTLSPTSALAALWNKPGLVLVNGTTVTHPTAPGTIHDLRRINGVVWAAGPGGVYKWNGSALVPITGNSFFSGTAPTSVAGDGQLIAVGTNTPGQKCLAVSNDGGSTWAWCGGRQRMILRNGNPYWLASATNGFGGSHYSVSQVAVQGNTIMSAGRSGIWASYDGGLTFYPVGPGGSEDSTVKVGPGANEFACNDNDWTCLHTLDGWQTMDRRTTAPGGNAGLSWTAGGNSYRITKGTTCDITKNGASIADDYFRGAAALAVCGGGNAAGMQTIGLYGGGVLVGHP